MRVCVCVCVCVSVDRRRVYMALGGRRGVGQLYWVVITRKQGWGGGVGEYQFGRAVCPLGTG